MCFAGWNRTRYCKHNPLSSPLHPHLSGESPACGKGGMQPSMLHTVIELFCQQLLCFQWALVKEGRDQSSLVWKLILHCSAFRLPRTPIYREMSWLTAALLPHWIEGVLHLQGEVWGSKYEFTQQRELAIGSWEVEMAVDLGALQAFAMLCCPSHKAFREVTVSFQSPQNNVALIQFCVSLRAAAIQIVNKDKIHPPLYGTTCLFRADELALHLLGLGITPFCFSPMQCF